MRCSVKALLNEWGESKSWSSNRANEVAEYIRVDSPQLWDRPPIDVLNVANGLLNCKTRELRPHDPAHLSPIQLPVKYDAAAKCPGTEKFVSEVYPPDAIDLAWELRAWLMLPLTHLQKAALLIGEGANGKSCELAAIAALIGRRNIASVSLHKLESDRFATARLVGKLANICPDLPSQHLAGTSTFKALTGGDTMNAERKFSDSFEFDPFARLIFSANHPPESSDSSEAFFRRWLVVPFERTFGPGEQTPRAELDAKLADPAERSGVLNRALDALPKVIAGGFSEPESVCEAAEEFREATDPVAVWFDTHLLQLPNALTSKGSLILNYNADAHQAGRQALTKMALGKALRRWLPGISHAQRTIAGKVQWSWIGIGLKSEHEP